MTANFTGSRYLLTDNCSTLAEIRFQSRISSSTDELGPCRRFSVDALTQPICPALKERRLSEVTCDDAIIQFEPPQSTFFQSLDPTVTMEGRYVLNFGHGETVVASVKNFILNDIHGRTALMMFKVDRNKYCMKLNSELMSPLIAFGICLSSIDRKLCTQ